MGKLQTFLPYGAGLFLLLLVIGVDMAAVRLFFGDTTLAALIGIFLVLEGLFFLHHNQIPLNSCSQRGLKRWTRRFYRMFLAMGACSTAAFAIKASGLPLAFMAVTKAVFWLLVVVLLVIGAGMALCVIGVHGADADEKPNAHLPPPTPIYGRAGYGWRNQSTL